MVCGGDLSIPACGLIEIIRRSIKKERKRMETHCYKTQEIDYRLTTPIRRPAASGST